MQLNIIFKQGILRFLFTLRTSLHYTSCVCQILIYLENSWPNYDHLYFLNLFNIRFKTFQFLIFNIKNNHVAENSKYKKVDPSFHSPHVYTFEELISRLLKFEGNIKSGTSSSGVFKCSIDC